MFAFILILMMIIIGSSTVSKPNEFNKNYISRDGTAAIKGIFVILVFLSHAVSYFSNYMTGFFDDAYRVMQNHIGQMVVAMFLFYSGYGIMEQIKKRKNTYVKSIATKRFPNLFLNYNITSLFYLILAICLGKGLTIKKILLSIVAWDGIGQSTWFIFVTLSLYILTFISFYFIGRLKNEKYYIINIIILSVLTAAFIVGLYFIGKESYWWDTALLFVLGFWYSYFKEYIEKIVMKNDIVYLAAVAAVAVLYVYTKQLSYKHLIFYTVYGFMFVAAVVIFTMKVEIKSNLLSWFGDHIFSIYILQRIPLIILHEMGISHAHRYVFVILSFAITCAIAEVYDVLYAKLSSKIWKPKKQ